MVFRKPGPVCYYKYFLQLRQCVQKLDYLKNNNGILNCVLAACTDSKSRVRGVYMYMPSAGFYAFYTLECDVTTLKLPLFYDS